METGSFPSVSWPVPNIKLERPQQVRKLPKAVPIDKEALKDTFSKFAEWEQRSQGTGPKQNSRKRGLDIVTDVAEDVWDGARRRRGRTPRDFGDMDKGDDDGPRKKQKTGEAASLKPSRHEKKDFLGQVIYGIGRNLRSPIYRAGSRWQEPFPTGRFKNPDGLVRALDIAMKGVRRNPAHSVESWKEHVEREVQLDLGEGWNASEWTKVMEIGTDDGKSQPERLCAFFEFAWDSGAYGKAFNECHSPARAQAYGILAQAVEAREERWQGISKREIIRKINSLGKDGYNVLTKELERRWDEIIDMEERAAGCVHALLGDTFRDFRAVSEIDGRPHECDTPDKKQLWDVGRRYLTKATAMREGLGNVVRGCGWQDGVYMGREWMKGATPAFIAVVGGIFEVFANRPDFKSTSSLAGEIHYLRRLLGEGRFYESEWVPILDMLRRTDGVLLQATWAPLQKVVSLPEARHRWADISSRARELWREHGNTVGMPIAIDLSLAELENAGARSALQALGKRPMIAGSRWTLRAQVEDTIGLFPHTETWAGYFADVHNLKLGRMDGVSFRERWELRENVWSKVLGRLAPAIDEPFPTLVEADFRAKLKRYLVEFHYRNLDSDEDGQAWKVESTSLQEDFAWSKPAGLKEVDVRNVLAVREAREKEREKWET